MTSPPTAISDADEINLHGEAWRTLDVLRIYCDAWRPASGLSPRDLLHRARVTSTRIEWADLEARSVTGRGNGKRRPKRAYERAIREVDIRLSYFDDAAAHIPMRDRGAVLLAARRRNLRLMSWDWKALREAVVMAQAAAPAHIAPDVDHMAARLGLLSSRDDTYGFEALKVECGSEAWLCVAAFIGKITHERRRRVYVPNGAGWRAAYEEALDVRHVGQQSPVESRPFLASLVKSVGDDWRLLANPPYGWRAFARKLLALGNAPEVQFWSDTAERSDKRLSSLMIGCGFPIPF